MSQKESSGAGGRGKKKTLPAASAVAQKAQEPNPPQGTRERPEINLVTYVWTRGQCSRGSWWTNWLTVFMWRVDEGKTKEGRLGAEDRGVILKPRLEHMSWRS